MKNSKEEIDDKIFTIPNALSLLRLCLIPLFVWLYCTKQNYVGTTIVLLVSGLTDIIDGFIARKFNMVSNLGKALDPVADKLTQGAMLFCLLTNFPYMLIPLILLVIKEIFSAVTGLVVIRKTGKVYGAEWHGKLTTCTIYAMILLHLVWPAIPFEGSVVCIALSIGIMGCASCPSPPPAPTAAASPAPPPPSTFLPTWTAASR